MIMHHTSKIGKSLKKSRNAEKVVALSSMGSEAQLVRLRPANDLFHDKHAAFAEASSTHNLETFESAADFKILKSEKANIKTLRSMLLLSPFALSAMLPISSRGAPATTCSISTVTQNFKD